MSFEIHYYFQTLNVSRRWMTFNSPEDPGSLFGSSVLTSFENIYTCILHEYLALHKPEVAHENRNLKKEIDH